MPTKIESHLSPEELHEFFKRCAQTKGGTKLSTIQAIAEEFGVSISLMSASAVRDGALSDYLAELKSKREMAEQVSEVAKSGLSLSDAAASAFASKVFDAALKVDAAEIGGEAANNLSLAISRLRTGDRGAKKLEADLRLRDEQIAKLAREKTEWEEARRKVAAATDKLRNASPASADEIRAKVVEELDRIMGITK